MEKGNFGRNEKLLLYCREIQHLKNDCLNKSAIMDLMIIC